MILNYPQWQSAITLIRRGGPYTDAEFELIEAYLSSDAPRCVDSRRIISPRRCRPPPRSPEARAPVDPSVLGAKHSDRNFRGAASAGPDRPL
jgi:hypothetical protein